MGNDPSEQEQRNPRRRARNTTLNTAKRPSKAEDVRDRPNKRRLAPKPRQLMSTSQRSFLFPSATNDSASKSQINSLLQQGDTRNETVEGVDGFSLCCISLWPASSDVLHRWPSAKGAVQLVFTQLSHTTLLVPFRGLVLRRRSNPLFPFGDQCATRLLFITRHREAGETM